MLQYFGRVIINVENHCRPVTLFRLNRNRQRQLSVHGRQIRMQQVRRTALRTSEKPSTVFTNVTLLAWCWHQCLPPWITASVRIFHRDTKKTASVVHPNHSATYTGTVKESKRETGNADAVKLQQLFPSKILLKCCNENKIVQKSSVHPSVRPVYFSPSV